MNTANDKMYKRANWLTDVIKEVGVGGLAGAPVGAGIYGARALLNKPYKLDYPEEVVQHPLIEHAGPLREGGVPEDVPTALEIIEALAPESQRPELRRRLEQIVAAKERLERVGREKASTLKKKGVSVLHALGAGGGVLAGNALMQSVMERKRAEKLDALIAARKQLLDTLLRQEQSEAAGLGKLGAITDEGALGLPTIGALKENVQASWPGLNRWARIFMGGAGAIGLLYGLRKAYEYALASDENRAIKKKLEAALAARLGSTLDERGHAMPRAPMIVKLRGERIGTQPLRPGASSMAVEPSAGRDVLGF